MKMRRLGRLAAALCLAGFLAGCFAVGPDYKPPEPQAPKEWIGRAEAGLPPAKMENPKELAFWWKRLGDETLTGLIERALQANTDLRTAEARLREARAALGVARSGLFPTLDASAAFQTTRSNKNAGVGGRRDLYSGDLDAGWEIDVFGGLRRGVEAAEGDLEAAGEDLDAVRVSLAAETALSYVELRTLAERLRVAEGNLKTKQETYELTQYRNQAGLTTSLDVEKAKYSLEDTRSTIPSLRSAVRQSLNRLAVLLGVPPGSLDEELAAKKPIPEPKADIAIGLPLEALRRRPDVRRAERELAAQSARVGVAVAELYPKFKLFGSTGLESLSAGSFFSADSWFASLGPQISWRVFAGGALRRGVEVQDARLEQAQIAYEASVLSALEETENALKAFAEEQQRRVSLGKATAAAQNASILARQQYESGTIDFQDVLEAERALLTFQDQLVQSQGAVTSDLIRLYKSVCGGWGDLAEKPEGAAEGKSPPEPSKAP